MLTQMESIVSNKQQNKVQLIKLRNNCFSIIYGGLIEQRDIKSIHTDLIKETKKTRYGLQLLKSFTNITSKISKMIPSTEEGIKNKALSLFSIDKETLTISMAISVIVFIEMFKKNKVDTNINQKILKITNDIETLEKANTIKEELKENRKNKGVIDTRDFGYISVSKMFYLCSSHDDCAEDHLPYQGKMYIDEKWQSLVHSPQEKALIQLYISKHNIQSLQMVMDKPVWLITRPNCRHFFKALPTEEVLKYDIKVLTKNYKTHRAIGDRQYLQTLRHSTNKKWYEEIRNAELILEKYKERLNLHQELYKKFKSLLVKNAIQKDKMLIAKWNKYIEQRKKQM